MTEESLYHLLLLSSISGIGHNRMRTLIAKFGSPENVFRAPFRQLTATEGFDKKTAERLRNPAYRDERFADEQVRLMRRYDAHAVGVWEPGYPAPLKNIHDPPAFLFVRGAFGPEDEQAVAIVGTREPTPYGRGMAEVLARELALRGITVVSGLARGIDTAAHQAALAHGGRTLAVLGSGVDRIYPSENFKLAMAVTASGAVVSDYPMRTPPDAVHFPGRNRIISGLSLGTVIVEAGEKSGALITADYALEQNRELFAVPGLAGNPRARGPNHLIRQGAKLVETVDDILAELDARLTAAKEPPRPVPAWTMTAEEQIIFDHLGDDPTHVDAISNGIKLSVAETLGHLLHLELMGAVRQLAGKHFIRA